MLRLAVCLSTVTVVFALGDGSDSYFARLESQTGGVYVLDVNLPDTISILQLKFDDDVVKPKAEFGNSGLIITIKRPTGNLQVVAIDRDGKKFPGIVVIDLGDIALVPLERDVKSSEIARVVIRRVKPEPLGPIAIEDQLFLPPAKVGEQYPPFTVGTVDKQVFRSADQAGKVIVIDVWATWCSPCLTATRTLTAVTKELAKNGDPKDKVVVVAICADSGDTRGEAKKKMKGLPPSWYNVMLSSDPDARVAFTRSFLRRDQLVLPLLYAVGKDGILHQLGAEGMARHLEDELWALIRAPDANDASVSSNAAVKGESHQFVDESAER